MSHPGRFIWVSALLMALSAAAICGEIVTRDAASGVIYCRSQRLLVPYEAADSGPSGIATVILFVTTDNGATWAECARRPEAKGAFDFGAPSDGVYGFTVQAIDKAGNVESKEGPSPGTKPEITVVVDSKPPQLEAVFPRQDLELVPGAHLRVRFRAQDANLSPSTAKIAVKTTDAQSWTDLANVTYQDSEFFAQGDILFAGAYSVKIGVSDKAGNSADETYTFTCTPNARPRPKEEGPTGSQWEVPIIAPPRAKSLVFDIDYKVEDIGGQPPAAVGLWYTTDNGNTWQFYGLDSDVMSPFRFQAPVEGIYGFKLTATTKSGVSEAPPHAGVKPDIATLVDVTFPTLMLDDPRGGESYRGGDVHYLKWTARDGHFGSLPITIYTSRDGGPWELLAADLPNNGTYGWNVPRIEFANYRLKIEARDQVGNTTAVTSDVFHIVSAAPETHIKAIIPSISPISVTQMVIIEPTSTGSEVEKPKVEAVTPPPTGKGEAEVKDLVDKATGMRMRGDYEGAETALREAAKRDAKNVVARNELGAIMILQGRYSEAAQVLEQARAFAPEDVEVLYNLGVAYYSLGRYADAAKAYETISVADPRNEAALWSLGSARLAAKDLAGARQAWQSILAVNSAGSPFVPKARKALATYPEPAPKK